MPSDIQHVGEEHHVDVTEDCQYVAIAYSVEMEVQPGVTGERPGVLLAANLCEPSKPAYEVVRIAREGEGILGLTVYGREIVFCCAPNELRIADIRRDTAAATYRLSRAREERITCLKTHS